MLQVLDNHRAEGVISRREEEVAILAQKLGDQTFTLGYELEVMPSAMECMPRLEGALTEEYPEFSKEVYECTNTLDNLRYKFHQNEAIALYETQSPISRHALPLIIATRGLARSGVLPNHAGDRDVTAHVNIGTTTELVDGSSTHHRLIRMLRVVELLGGSNKTRLTIALEQPSELDQKWHTRGTAGVNLHVSNKTQWVGKNNRAELRSLFYKNPDQFGRTLETIYYLSRGLLSTDGLANQVYDYFDSWLVNFLRWNNLEDIGGENYDNINHRVCDEAYIANYIGPFAQHLETADKTELIEETTDTIERLKQVFNMEEIPSLDDLEPYDVDLYKESHKDRLRTKINSFALRVAPL